MDIVCDLVLLSWNHLEETRPCLESLFRSTKSVACRLIIVDNGSEPHVREFLRSVRPQGAIREVILLQNETNEGFPKGMNRGIHASRAPYVCILNNDLQFTHRWLIKMVEVAQAHPDIGVVNPESSTFGNHPPRGMSLDTYAGVLEAKRGSYVEVGMCIGFCMLIKREVIERIGVLTEEVERIFFEDEDYSMRATAAGYRCVVANGSYVYHAEHRTVQRMGERERIFQRNRAWCEAKWGKRLRIAYPRFTEVIPGTPELRAWLEQMVHWARQRVYVYVYCPLPPHVTKEELFRSVGLVPHVDVLWHTIPHRLASWAALISILKRQKKPFDVVVVPDERWAARLERWRPLLHQAQVLVVSDTNALTHAWRPRSLSPSLS